MGGGVEGRWGWRGAGGARGGGANSGVVTFPVVTGTDTTATHYAIFDAATAGVMISYGALSASKTYSAGDVPSFLAGQLTITLV